MKPRRDPQRSWRFDQGSRRGPCSLAIRPRSRWQNLPDSRGRNSVCTVPGVLGTDDVGRLAGPLLLQLAPADSGASLCGLPSLRSPASRGCVRVPRSDARPVGGGGGRGPRPRGRGPRGRAGRTGRRAAGSSVAPGLRGPCTGAPRAPAGRGGFMAGTRAGGRRTRAGRVGSVACVALGPPPAPARRPDRPLPPRTRPARSPRSSRRLWYGAFNATFAYRGSADRGSSR